MAVRCINLYSFLLALFAPFDKGLLQTNCISISPELVAAFRIYWQALVPAGTWQERIAYPFRHLAHEGLWELLKDGEPVSARSVRNANRGEEDVRKWLDAPFQLASKNGLFAQNAMPISTRYR